MPDFLNGKHAYGSEDAPIIPGLIARGFRCFRGRSSNLGQNNGRADKLDPQDRAFPDWYGFVLSFTPGLVRHEIEKFKSKVAR